MHVWWMEWFERDIQSKRDMIAGQSSDMQVSDSLNWWIMSVFTRQPKAYNAPSCKL